MIDTIFLLSLVVIYSRKNKRLGFQQARKEDFVDVDFLLIRKMKQGDDDAFDVFVRKYYNDILKYCSYHCFDAEYAEDLTQETFANFFAKLSDYRYKGKTKNYLYTIAGNLCKNYYKQQKPLFIEEDQLSELESPSDNLEEKITDRMMLEWALEQLPDEFRQVIDLYYFQEMKLIEIASILGIGLPLVKYRLKQARNRLQYLLRREGTIHEPG